jgi:hypothetical protein
MLRAVAERRGQQQVPVARHGGQRRLVALQQFLQHGLLVQRIHQAHGRNDVLGLYSAPSLHRLHTHAVEPLTQPGTCNQTGHDHAVARMPSR